MDDKGSSLISLRRGIRVLEFVSLKKGGGTFSEIRARFPDMTPATLTRLLKSLLDEELLSKSNDGRNYRTGIAAKNLATAILGNTSIADILRPVIRDLAEKSGESALFTVFEDDAIRLLVKHEVPEGFHYMDENMFNRSISSHPFAITCLAFQPKERLKALFENKALEVESRKDYDRIFEEIRRDNVFVSRNENDKKIMRVTSPVFFGDGGEFAGAIGISLFPKGDEKKRLSILADHVREAARKASLLLVAKIGGRNQI